MNRLVLSTIALLLGLLLIAGGGYLIAHFGREAITQLRTAQGKVLYNGGGRGDRTPFRSRNCRL